MFRPKFIQLTGVNGDVEATALFPDEPNGTVRIRYRDGREEVKALDDLPKHWLTQLNRWNLFGRQL